MRRHLLPLLFFLALCFITGCASSSGRNGHDLEVNELEVQAFVMEMADEYVSSLSEAIYVDGAAARTEPRARALTQAFLRNGVGAAVDIAAGPNPNVALLDLLVLASLQAHAFEANWISAGIPAAEGEVIAARLREGEAQLWDNAQTLLTAAQLGKLREQIDAWIADNPDRLIVALVRFEDLNDARRDGGRAAAEARGVLRQLTQATASVDDARLLGERALWFTARYPYILGQQAELTAYRLANEPESREVMEVVRAARQASERLSTELDRVPQRIADERAAAMTGLEVALERAANRAVDRAFDRFDTNAGDSLGEVRQTADAILPQIEKTLMGGSDLVDRLAAAAASAERLLDRLNIDGTDDSAANLRDMEAAARQVGEAAAQVSGLLDQADAAAASDAWAARGLAMEQASDRLVDRIFLRGVGLVLLLIVGLAAIRLIPRRGERIGAET